MPEEITPPAPETTEPVAAAEEAPAPTAEDIRKELTAGFPRYQCHKQVRALKIAAVQDPTERGEDSDSGVYLHFEAPWPSILASKAFEKYGPEAGGYYLVYENGVEAYLPAAAFEDRYTLVP